MTDGRAGSAGPPIELHRQSEEPARVELNRAPYPKRDSSPWWVAKGFWGNA